MHAAAGTRSMPNYPLALPQTGSEEPDLLQVDAITAAQRSFPSHTRTAIHSALTPGRTTSRPRNCSSFQSHSAQVDQPPDAQKNIGDPTPTPALRSAVANSLVPANRDNNGTSLLISLSHS